MKKLNIKLDGVKETLTKDQMRKITGGYGNDFCVPHNCAAGEIRLKCGPPGWNATNLGCATVYYYDCHNSHLAYSSSCQVY